MEIESDKEATSEVEAEVVAKDAEMAEDLVEE
jgi:hypothetical protein